MDRANVYQCNIRNITERKQAEEVLRDNQHRVSEALEFNQKILNSSSIGILTYKESGQCVSANASAARITGGTLAQLLTQNFHEIQSWKKSGMYQAAIQALDTGIEQSLEVHIVTTFGRDIWVNFSFSPFTSASERHLLVFASDITERKNTEELLRESEERYRLVQENSMDAILLTAPDGSIITANQAACEMFGMTEEEIRLSGRHGLVDQEDPRLPVLLEERIRTGKARGELTMLRRDGSKFPVEISSSIFVDKNGDKKTSMIIRDITGRKLAEEKLGKEQIILQTLIDNLPDTIFVKDADSRIILDNMAHRHLLGTTTLEQVVGKTDFDFFPREMASSYLADEKRVVQSGKSLIDREEPVVDQERNQRWLLTTKVPLRDPQGKITGIVGINHDITDRKRAEETLRASEEHYKMMFESAPIAINITRGTEITYANPSYLKMFGFSNLEELKSVAPLELFSPEVRPLILDNIRRRVEGLPVPPSYEAECFRKDGARFTVLLYLARLIFSDGPATVGFIQDITERKRAEEKLRQDEILLRTLIDNLPDRIYVMDVHGRKLLSNIADMQASGGKVMEDVIGKTDLETYPPELAQAFWALDRQVIETGRPVINREEPGLDSHGDPVWVLSSKMPLRNDSGRIIGLVGIGRDISQRKQVEDALRASETRYRSLFENSPVSLWEQDFSSIKAHIDELKHQGITDFREYLNAHPDVLLEWINEIRVLDVNQATLEMEHALAKEQLIGNLKQVVRIDAGIGFLEEFVNIAEGRNDFTWEGINYTLEGERLNVILKWSAAPGYEDTLGKVLLSLIDITGRKKMEQTLQEYNLRLEQQVEARTRELRDAQEQLVRKERLAVLGELAGSVGHELRNPLGIISGAIYYLKMVQPDADEKVRQYHEMIASQTLTAEKIITDLLDFARLSGTEPQAVDVPDLVQRVLTRFPVPPSVQVALDLPDGLPMILVDPKQIEQVLGNLVINACQAMTEPSLKKTASLVTMPGGGRLTISALLQAGSVIIRVEDTGVGIPPENLQKIFEPLFTTRASGIGLGLAVSKKLAEANGGRIEVQSESGKGTTFTVYLPINRSEPGGLVVEWLSS